MWRVHAPCSSKDLHYNNISFKSTNLLNTSFNLFIDDVIMRKLILVLSWTNCLIVFVKCCFYKLKKMQVFRNEWKKNQSLHLFSKIWGFFKLMFMPDTQSFVMYILSGNYSIVCIGVSHLPLTFLPSPSPHHTPLHLQTGQALPHFR